MPRKLYCTVSSLEEIFIFKEGIHADLNTIVLTHRYIALDITDEQLIESQAGLNPVIMELMSLGTFRISCEPKLFEDFESNFSTQDGNSVFIINESNARCQELSEEYGCCVLSQDNLTTASQLTDKVTYRQLIANQVLKDSSCAPPRVGWQVWLKDLPRLPMNSLVLIDNYILKDIESRSNVYPLLDAILPIKLKIEFHLLIVTRCGRGWAPGILKEFISKTIADLNRPYTIKLGVLTHFEDKEFHNRAFVTGMHIGTSEHGFAAFKGDKAKSNNNIRIEALFSDINKLGSDTPWISMGVELNSTADLLRKNKRGNGLVTTNIHFETFEDCDNRLLKILN